MPSREFYPPKGPQDYEDLFRAMVLEPTICDQLPTICAVIRLNERTYETVGSLTGFPWYLIAAIHYRECNLKFDRYWQNGDPLWDSEGRALQTVHEPKNVGPFKSWADSAIFDLKHRENLPKTWSVGHCLSWAEHFNGLGYLEKSIASPYIWGGTKYYESGLFVGDGRFDFAKRDGRPGVATIISRLIA